ncbi:MAG: MBL fold metallo-hydrolase, partial [Pseudomonadota bacterium]
TQWGASVCVRPDPLSLSDQFGVLSASAPLGKIETIIVTHAHRDHTGGLSEIARATGARVWMHEADAELIAQGQWIRPYTHAGTPLSWLLDNVIVKRYPETVSAFTDFELANSVGCQRVCKA